MMVAALTDPVEDNLMANLFANYTVSSRPVGPGGGGVTVFLSLFLMSMERLVSTISRNGDERM